MQHSRFVMPFDACQLALCSQATRVVTCLFTHYTRLAMSLRIYPERFLFFGWISQSLWSDGIVELLGHALSIGGTTQLRTHGLGQYHEKRKSLVTWNIP